MRRLVLCHLQCGRVGQPAFFFVKKNVQKNGTIPDWVGKKKKIFFPHYAIKHLYFFFSVHMRVK